MSRNFDHDFERPRLFEEMSGLRHDFKRAFATQCAERGSVESENFRIAAANDQDCRCFHSGQRPASEIGSPSAGDDRPDTIAEPRGGNERGGRSGARAEISQG